jgi:glycosyltransferase involved in cell wall biosynthesis
VHKQDKSSASKYVVLRVWPFWIDGIKYHDQHLAEFMEVDGVSTVFACPDYATPDYSSFAKSKKIERGKSNYRMLFLRYFTLFGKPFPYQIIKFKRQIKSLSPDVIHIFGISNFTSIFALVAARLASFKGKILFNDHSDPNERRSGFLAGAYYLLFFIIYRLLIRNRYTVIVPDIAARNELIRRYGPGIGNVIKLISLGYDDEVFYSRDAVRGADLPLVIGFAGRIVPEKKLELLINSVLQFNAGDIDLYIAGLNVASPSKYQSSLINYIQSTGRDNIKIRKFITSPGELASFYSMLDVAIFPGSISITTFEANGCGCPIILYRSVDGLEHRVSNLRGRLFETPQQLIEYINYFLELKRVAKIDHSGVEIESRDYSWSRLKRKYYNEYGFILSSSEN